jgi:hypothetical protein
MVEKHLSDLRADPRYMYAVIYVYIEANLSWVTANDMARLCMQPRFYPVIVQSFDTSKDMRYGVWTGPAEKEMYTNEMKRALSDGAIAYADDFISSDREVKSEVRSQLEVYRRSVKFTEGSEKASVTYTGKSSGRKDDLAIVLQMLLYWSRVVRCSSEYAEASVLNGWKF